MDAKKILAFFIDYIVAASIMVVFFFFFVMFPLLSGNKMDSFQIFSKTLILSYIAILYLVLSDLPRAGSLGKKIMKLRIIDTNTKTQATIKQRFVRNLFWIFGPVEIIVYLILRRRIGDIVAKTEIVDQ